MSKSRHIKYSKNKLSNKNLEKISVQLFNRNNFHFIILIFILLIYLHNLTRDIYAGDIGDLVTAAYVFGIPHPPGYALFTILGVITSHIPFLIPIVTRVGLISVMSSLLGLLIVYNFSFKITKSLLISVLCVLILAFSYPFWIQTEIPEVFALNNFLVIIILYLAFLFYQEKKEKYLYLLIFFCSLSLTHHNTILTIFPSVFILIIKHWKYIFFENKKRILYLLLCIILGLIPFLYIPIASSHNPPINWDNVTDLNSFFNLILRKDYGQLNIVSNTQFIVRIITVNNYFSSLISAYSLLILSIFILGIIKLIRTDIRLALSFITAYILSGPLLIFYIATTIISPHQWGVIERIYVLSFVVCIFFLPYGFMFIKNFMDSILSRKIYSLLIICYFFIIPVLFLKYNFPKTDLSKTQIGNTLALNILLPLSQNSILFTGGDTTTFNIWYQHYALGIRPDIYIINPHGIEYLKKIINQNDLTQKKVSLYSTQPIKLQENVILVPKGLVFEIMPKKDLPTKNNYINDIQKFWNIKPTSRKDLAESETNFIATEIPLLYSNAYLRTGNFINYYYKDPKLAQEFFQKSVSIDTENSEAYFALGINQYKLSKDCKNSEENINKAISYYPVWEPYYKYLYVVYKNCGKTTKELDILAKDYFRHFNENIDIDMDYNLN